VWQYWIPVVLPVNDGSFELSNPVPWYATFIFPEENADVGKKGKA
jgi:hypothetical protein